MPARSYQDLRVWRAAMDLVVPCYGVASGFPKHEQFGLGAQIRRASVSVPANIAEGYGRVHRGDYVRHLSIAQGSLKELTTLLEIALRLSYIETGHLRPLESSADEIGRMLYAMITRLRAVAGAPGVKPR